MKDHCCFLNAAIWLVLAFLFVSNSTFLSVSIIDDDRERGINLQKNAAGTPVSLAFGELPGYTGWARPEYTSAGLYEIVSQKLLGDKLSVIVQCTECGGSNAQFYARAYGPAALAGSVQSIGKDTYNVEFSFMDAGSYTVEVVLTSSDAPLWEDYPVVGNEPLYEGYLLPGFPFQVHVDYINDKTSPDHMCSFSDLMSESSDSEHRKARWVVVDKVAHRNHAVAFTKRNYTSNSVSISFRGYKLGRNSLGIFMDYKPRGCFLLPLSEAVSRLASCATTTNAIHVIFIGDSVMHLQKDLFHSIFPNFKSTFISTSTGITQMMPNVTSTLLKTKEDFPDEKRYILFNTGLHDIARLCRYWKSVREDNHNPYANYTCVVEYQCVLRELVEFVHGYPADLKVFQSTTAAWLRYGNFGFEWPVDEPQVFSTSSNMIAHFNKIAYSIMFPVQDITVLDAYWMTLARPDNREIGINGMLGRHLVHPGQEVADNMMRIFIHALLSSKMCPN